MDIETRLKKAHIQLLKHPETCAYAGVVLFGKTVIETAEASRVPTACTDGVNTYYNAAFIEPLKDAELVGLVLHENLHKALRHLMRFRGLCKQDAQLANAATDYVVNDVIMSLKDKALAQLPQGGLYDPRFHGWSVLDVWEYLLSGRKTKDDGNSPNPLPSGKPKRGQNNKGQSTVTIGGEEFSLDGIDEHDHEQAAAMPPEEIGRIEEQIKEAIQQGALLAGRMGARLPRTIQESLVREIDWRVEMQEFVTTSCAGRDELTWRQFNRKRLADELYFPSSEDETVHEVIASIDTSGSIGGEALSGFAAHLAHVCQQVKPDRVRVLWWDTTVHGEQVFVAGQYDNLKNLLKPLGGGGTRAGCVADYVYSKRLTPDCIVMFTDGYTEQPIDWRGVTAPTLWLVTAKRDFVAPSGHRQVRFRIEPNG